MHSDSELYVQTCCLFADVHDVIQVCGCVSNTGDVYECVTSWHDNDRSFVVVRQQQEQQRRRQRYRHDDVSLVCLVRLINSVTVSTHVRLSVSP